MATASQDDQSNDQPLQVSSECQLVQHTNTSQLIVSIPRQSVTVGIASQVTMQSASSSHNLTVSIPVALVTMQNPNQLIVSIPELIARPSKLIVHIPKKLVKTKLAAIGPTKKRRCPVIIRTETVRDNRSLPIETETGSHHHGCDDDDKSDNDTVSNLCPDFHTLYKALYDARPKWHNLGLALGMDQIDAKCICEKERDDHEKCLRETLRKLTETKKLTWTDIVTALNDPTVGQYTLANRIREKFLPETIIQSSSGPSVDSLPDYICQYTSFLKSKYKTWSPFPDDWPPRLKEEKFTKLALIERKQQIQLPQARHTQSIEYDYAIGNIDNIAKRKQEINLDQFFSHFPGISTNREPQNFIVLMDGAPGVGKTTLTRKICIDWAEGKLLTDHQIVILKPLREMRDHTTASQDIDDDLFGIIEANGPNPKQVLKHLKNTSGSGVMFIFDGFDELSSEQQYNKSTLLWKLITGIQFDKCSVLVTSRSYASDPIQEISRVNRHVEVLGFKRRDIECCIKQNITDKKIANTLIQMLKERLDIISLCYIPLNCRIVLYVYQQLGTLPDTLTQLYEVFIVYTIKHYKNKISVIKNKKSVQQASRINNFPSKVKSYIKLLSKTAYQGIDKKKLVFEFSELLPEESSPQEREEVLELGLLSTIGDLKVYCYYQFLHLTIQEFLAARHLASVKSDEELLEFFKTNLYESKFRMTLIFLSGLSTLNFLENEKDIPNLKQIDFRIQHNQYESTIKDVQKKEKKGFLFLAHILYESQQTTHNWLLPCLATNSLDLSGHTLTQFDCLVLANFLAMTPEDYVWDEINLSECGLTNDCLQILLAKTHQKQDISCLFLTKKIVVHTRYKKDSIDLLTPLLMKDSKVESLDIPIHHFPKSCKTIKDYDSSNKTSVKLISISEKNTSVINISKDELSYSYTLCSGVLLKLLEYGAKIKYISKLHLSNPKVLENCSKCDTSGCDTWESVVKQCRYIQKEIQISKREFTYFDVLSLTESLKYNRTLVQITLTTDSKISYENLVQLKLSTQVSVTVKTQGLTLSISSDNYVHIKLNGDKDCSLSHYLKQSLPPELQGVKVTIKENVPKSVLELLAKSKIVTSLTLQPIDTPTNTPIAEAYFQANFQANFQEMLENTQTLQTLTLDDCELSDTFIKHLEDGLSHNTVVALTVKTILLHSYGMLQIRSQNLYELEILINLTKEDATPFFQIIKVCKQLKVLRLNNFCGQNITDVFKSLFQILPSTCITTLEVRQRHNERLGYEESLIFKEFVNNIKILKVLKVGQLSNEALNGIIFTPQSPLIELKLSLKEISEERKTEFFNSLKFSHIAILNITFIHLSESYTAFKQLLTDNKTLTALSVDMDDCKNNIIVSCIAEALTQNCSLQELTIDECSSSNQEWTKLFKSLHCNTTLLTLNLSESIPSGENTESLCEMLLYNKHLQNLIIGNKLIEGHYKEFANAYTQRQPVLNLTVKDLDIKLVEEIEKLQPSFDCFYIHDTKHMQYHNHTSELPGVLYKSISM